MKSQKNSKQIILVTVIIMLALAMVQLPAGTSAYNDWAGVWSTNYGDMKLIWTDGGGLAGTFGQSGRLVGEPADPWASVIRGTWSDHGTSGMFEFRMNDDMKGFQGWRNSPGNLWEGSREIVPAPID